MKGIRPLFWVLAILLAASTAAAQGTGRDARSSRLRAMGQAYLAAGDPGSAIGYFRDAIRVNPDDAEAYVALGEIYAGRGSVSDALEAYSAGIRRRPDHPGLWRGLARALERRGMLADAAEALRMLVERTPDAPESHAMRGELARRRGAWPEALASYRAVIDLGAGGATVEPELLADARRYVAALRVLVAENDPVRAVSCEDASEVRSALARCED